MAVKMGPVAADSKLSSINETTPVAYPATRGRSMFHMKRFRVRLPYAFF